MLHGLRACGNAHRFQRPENSQRLQSRYGRVFQSQQQEADEHDERVDLVAMLSPVVQRVVCDDFEPAFQSKDQCCRQIHPVQHLQLSRAFLQGRPLLSHSHTRH